MVDSNPGLTAKLEEEAFRTAMFHNFSTTPFTGFWNGKGRTFQPGDRKFMPKYLAEHYAKHLVNRELILAGKETSTSPKKPEQVPAFMELFNKAFILEDGGENQDQAQNQIDLAQKERTQPLPTDVPVVTEKDQPQIIGEDLPDDEESDQFDT